MGSNKRNKSNYWARKPNNSAQNKLSTKKKKKKKNTFNQTRKHKEPPHTHLKKKNTHLLIQPKLPLKG